MNSESNRKAIKQRLIPLFQLKDQKNAEEQRLSNQKTRRLWNVKLQCPVDAQVEKQTKDLVKENYPGKKYNGISGVLRGRFQKFWNDKLDLEPSELELLAELLGVSIGQLEFGERPPGAKEHLKIVHAAVRSETPARFRKMLELDSLDNEVSLKYLLESLSAAHAEGDFVYSPSLDDELANEIRKNCPLPDAIQLDVVRGDWSHANAHPMLDRAAFVLKNFVTKQVREHDLKQLGIGVGSGGTVRAVMDRFFMLLKNDKDLKSRVTNRELKFELWPLAASVDTRFDVDDIPSMFLRQSLLRHQLAELSDRIHATPQHSDRPKNLDEMKEEISVVISSIADTKDEHSMLLAHATRHESVKLLRSAVGEIQFRPYSNEGFLKLNARDLKKFPATLCEMTTLREFSEVKAGERKRLALLVAGKCLKDGCPILKDRPLKPLLKVEELRLVNHIVIASETAERLLFGNQKSRKKEKTS
jgi:hypothetical protein